MKRVILCAALLSACGSNLSVSVSTKPATGSPRALSVARNIDIQRVRLNVGRLKLEGRASGGGFTADDGRHDGDEDEDDEIEVRQGPFLIDLDADALNGAVTKVFDADVPAGTYEEFKFDIFPSAALQNASVIVNGTVGGNAFTFTSSLSARQKKEGRFVVGGSTANITLSIDPRGWFGSSAAQLDPTEANRAAIEANIRQSIDVFQDDDGDGHESRDGDHG
ncbi:MAG TPA: hypothetical protein VE964_19465 [Myxococcales bacterium]|nr:hypothetical protein [Myxococcales bacterium]